LFFILILEMYSRYFDPVIYNRLILHWFDGGGGVSL
jgi:hypothetical protein